MNVFTTRRQFLGTALVGFSGALLPPLSFSAGLGGRIVGVTTVNPKNDLEEVSSALVLDLASGEVDYHPLPDHRLGHSLVALPNGEFFAVPYGYDDVSCLFLDANFQTLSKVDPPADYGFGGHAALLPDQRHIVAHFNQVTIDDKRTPEQTGQLCLIDSLQKKVVSVMDSNILHGHDMLVSADGRYVIVGDDGTLEVLTGEPLKQSTDPFSLIPGTPKLSVFDATTLAPVREVPLDINGSLVHISEDHQGYIHAAVEQFVSNDEKGYLALGEALGDEIPQYVELLHEKIVELAIELPYPGPLMRIHPHTSEIQQQTRVEHQMPFDVRTNQQSGRVLNVFTASDVLSRFDPLKQRWGYFPTSAYNIARPYGLTDIPGTTMMAVNGFDNDIAIIDVVTMKLVKHISTENFGIKHLHYLPA